MFRLLFDFISCLLIPDCHFRSTHEVVEVEGALFALGGNDGSSSLNSVERYDPRLNKWNVVNAMVARRSSVGAAVLECFHLERGLVQTTNLWPLASITESFAAAAASGASNGTSGSGPPPSGSTAGTLTVPSRAEAAAFTANIALSSSAPSASSTLRRHRRETPGLAENRRANSNASSSGSESGGSTSSASGGGKPPATAWSWSMSRRFWATKQKHLKTKQNTYKANPTRLMQEFDCSSSLLWIEIGLDIWLLTKGRKPLRTQPAQLLNQETKQQFWSECKPITHICTHISSQDPSHITWECRSRGVETKSNLICLQFTYIYKPLYT